MKRIVHDFIWGSVQFSLSLRTMLLNSQIRKYFFKEINDLICDQVSEVRYMYSQDYSQERTQVQKKKNTKSNKYGGQWFMQFGIG